MAAPLNANVKHRILSATAALLSEKAFSEISLSDIAAQSDISKGTLYYYYNNKDDILFDVASEYLDRLAESLDEWTSNKQKDTSLPRLFNYTLERGAFDESGALRLYLIGAAVSGHSALRARLVERYISFKDDLRARIEERAPGVDSEYTAWALLTLMDGILVQSQLGNPSFDARAFIRHSVSLLAGALGGGASR